MSSDGGDGADLMTGGGGDDRFESPGQGGAAAQSHDGADVFNGGGGTDTVTYAGRIFDVDADIGGGANDGQTTDDLSDCPTGAGCEGDDIRADVENLTGGSEDDRLTGSGTPNVIAGGPGDDVLLGGASSGFDGADTFAGGGDEDEVRYTSRTDAIVADLDGAAGDDADGDTLGADVEHLGAGRAPTP